MRSTSLFESEMRSQVAAAQVAVTDAETGADPLLVQAARNHLDALIALARRNGLMLEPIAEAPALAAPAPVPAA